MPPVLVAGSKRGHAHHLFPVLYGMVCRRCRKGRGAESRERVEASTRKTINDRSATFTTKVSGKKWVHVPSCSRGGGGDQHGAQTERSSRSCWTCSPPPSTTLEHQDKLEHQTRIFSSTSDPRDAALAVSSTLAADPKRSPAQTFPSCVKASCGLRRIVGRTSCSPFF